LIQNFEDGIPLKKDDVFEFSFCIQAVHSDVVMMLQRKGLLEFDDPLEKNI